MQFATEEIISSNEKAATQRGCGLLTIRQHLSVTASAFASRLSFVVLLLELFGQASGLVINGRVGELALVIQEGVNPWAPCPPALSGL